MFTNPIDSIVDFIEYKDKIPPIDSTFVKK